MYFECVATNFTKGFINRFQEAVNDWFESINALPNALKVACLGHGERAPHLVASPAPVYVIQPQVGQSFPSGLL